jgi:hypothetical protein
MIKFFAFLAAAGTILAIFGGQAPLRIRLCMIGVLWAAFAVLFLVGKITGALASGPR